MSPSLRHEWPRGPRHALHDAASHGSTAGIVAVLASGSIGIDQGDPMGFTALMCAAFSGHASVSRILLDKGANVSITEDQGATALFFAVQQGHLDVTKLLVNAGSDLEAKNLLGYSPLSAAAHKGHTEVARVLIEAGANPNCRGPSGATPLWAAAFQGHKDIVTMLLRATANPLLPSVDGEGFVSLPLDAAAQFGHVDVVIELIQHVGIEGCGGASDGVVALCLTAQFAQVGAMAILTDAGVVDTGQALCIAAGNGYEGLVKFLLQEQQRKTWAASFRGGYVNATGLHRRTPLSCSIDACSPRVARRLLDAGAETATSVHASHGVGVVGAVTRKETPLAFTTRYIGELTADGKEADEEKLHKLEAIRRLLLQVDAVHATSWLWVKDISSCGAIYAERTVTTAAGTSLRLILPVLRRRARRPGVLLAPLWRYSAKASDETATKC